ncbi:MAG: hypothetical protein HYY04_13980 [Chloroflexi bacterium]|nr:hypothetical protein [Chloroflexota bacterium]
MVTMTRCPRCRGNMLEGHDIYGPHQTCLQCGHDESPSTVGGLDQFFDQFVRSQVDRPTSLRQRRRR